MGVRIVGLAAVLAVWAGLAGCGGGGGGAYATVSGKVTHQGQPVAEGKVTFHSTTESGGVRGEFATVTDGEGRYMVAGVGDRPGIPPGQYKVTVTKLVLKPGLKVPEEGWDLTQLELSGMGKNILPNQYGEYQSTKLSAILKQGDNAADFELK